MKLFSVSKKNAVLLSYISLALQTISSIVLTRIYLDYLGDDAYGLYQMIYSVAQYILILDLGIGTVMVRYISEFEARGEHEKTENFAFHFALIVIAVVMAIVGIGIIININIENIYPKLTSEDYIISHRLFVIMIFQLVITVISHYVKGICEAYDRFSFIRSVSIAQTILNFGLSYFFVRSGMGVIGIASANTIVIFIYLIIISLYAVVVLKFRVRFHHWDFSLLKPVLLLMLAMLLQAVVGHINGSVDKTILGIMTTKRDVTIYSIAASIVTMFNTIPTVISGVFQPSAMRLVVKEMDREKLTDFIIRPGRIQFMLIGGFVVAFSIFGKDFIACWAGADRTDAWLYVLVILIPNLVPLIQSTCLSILNALDKRIYRSIILAGMTLINIGLTIVLIKVIGPLGAPLATGISYIIGHGILMNIYYEKRIGLNIKRMFSSIFSKTIIAVVGTFVLTIPLVLWDCNESWIIFICKSVIFALVYSVLLWVVGLNQDEKDMALSFIKILKIKRR